MILRSYGRPQGTGSHSEGDKVRQLNLAMYEAHY